MVRATPTDEELLGNLPHLALAWNSPLSASHADRLLDRLELSHATRILDLGCGWGELLLRALARAPGLSGIGIERHRLHLERANDAAVARGLSSRVTFLDADLLDYEGAADRAICVGADHAWGGPGAALSRLLRHVTPSGKMLFGSGFWAQPPSAGWVEMFGDLPPSQGALVSLAQSAGWTVESTEAADLDEWDDFEATWIRDLDDIAAREGGSALGKQARRMATRRRAEYRDGYRGVLAFAYLVLTTA